MAVTRAHIQNPRIIPLYMSRDELGHRLSTVEVEKVVFRKLRGVRHIGAIPAPAAIVQCIVIRDSLRRWARDSLYEPAMAAPMQPSAAKHPSTVLRISAVPPNPAEFRIATGETVNTHRVVILGVA